MVDKKLVQAEQLGSEGKVDEALAVIRDVEKIKRKRNRIEKYLFRKSTEPAKEQKQIVCDECLLCIGLDDNELRVANHSSGRLHNALLEMRRKIAELAESLENAQLPGEWAKIDFSLQQNRPTSHLDLASTIARSRSSPRYRSRSRSTQRCSSRSWTSSSTSSRSRSRSTRSSRRSSRSRSGARGRHSGRRRSRSTNRSHGRYRSRSRSRSRSMSRSRSRDEYSSRRRARSSSRSWRTSDSRESTPRKRRGSTSRRRSWSADSDAGDAEKRKDNLKEKNLSEIKPENHSRANFLGKGAASSEVRPPPSSIAKNTSGVYKIHPDSNRQRIGHGAVEDRSKVTVKQEEPQRQPQKDTACSSTSLGVLPVKSCKSVQSTKSVKPTLDEGGSSSVQAAFKVPSRCPKVLVTKTKSRVKNETLKQNPPSKCRGSVTTEGTVPLDTKPDNFKVEPRTTAKKDAMLKLRIAPKQQSDILTSNVRQEGHEEPRSQGCDPTVNDNISSPEKIGKVQNTKNELCLVNERGTTMNANNPIMKQERFSNYKDSSTGCGAMAVTNVLPGKMPILVQKIKVEKEDDASLGAKPNLEGPASVKTTQSLKPAPNEDIPSFAKTSPERNCSALPGKSGSEQQRIFSKNVKVEKGVQKGEHKRCSVAPARKQQVLKAVQATSQSPVSVKTEPQPVDVIPGPRALTKRARDTDLAMAPPDILASRQRLKQVQPQGHYPNQSRSFARTLQNVSFDRKPETVADTKTGVRPGVQNKAEGTQKMIKVSRRASLSSLVGSTKSCRVQAAQSSSPLKPLTNVKKRSKSEQDQPAVFWDTARNTAVPKSEETRKSIYKSPDKSRQKEVRGVKRARFCGSSRSREQSAEGSLASKEHGGRSKRMKEDKKRASVKQRSASQKPPRPAKKRKGVRRSRSEGETENYSSEESDEQSREKIESAKKKDRVLKKRHGNRKSKTGTQTRQRRATRECSSSVTEDTVSSSSEATKRSAKKAKKRVVNKTRKARIKKCRSKASTTKSRTARRRSPKPRRKCKKSKRPSLRSPETSSSSSSSDEASTHVSSSNDGVKSRNHRRVKPDVARSYKRSKCKRSRV